jgi:hypothetical protein
VRKLSFSSFPPSMFRNTILRETRVKGLRSELAVVICWRSCKAFPGQPIQSLYDRLIQALRRPQAADD